MELANIKKSSLGKEKIEKAVRRTRKNAMIADFYSELGECYSEGIHFPIDKVRDKNKLENRYKFLCKAKRIKNCCRNWWYTEYGVLKIRDLNSTNACGSIFCESCQAKLAQQRFEKFAPQLEEFSKEYDIYHIVFTVPNVDGDELKPCLDRMYTQFAYINRLFTGNAKIKGIDFSCYGYQGAVRALEITKSKRFNNFHPHFHCYFILRKGLSAITKRKPENVNCYSFDNPDVKKSHKVGEGDKPRFFSDFEILLQKVWRLRYDGMKVTKANIEELPVGYSVLAERVDNGKYKEVFKYAMKGIFKNDGSNPLGTYYDFFVLELALHNRKIIQGYQALRKFVFDMPIDTTPDEEYLALQAMLQLYCPNYREHGYATIEEVLEEIEKGWTYISRSSYAELLEGGKNENAE